MMIRLFKRIRELYVKEGGAFPDPIVNLGWEYSDEEEADVIAREMNGYALTCLTSPSPDLRGHSTKWGS